MPVIIADAGFTINFSSIEEIKFVIDMLHKGIIEIEKRKEKPPYLVGFYPQPDDVFEPPLDDKKHWN